MPRVLLIALLIATASLGARADAGPLWFIQSVSTDGKHVLLRELTDDSATQHFRVAAADTDATEADLTLPVISSLPLESLYDGGGTKPVKLDMSTPGLAEELAKAGKLLGAFPFGAGGRLAAAPDGSHVAFNGGDWIFTAIDGKVQTRVSAEASYSPWFTPDGKTLLFRRENGLIDGVEGKYELYATSVDGKRAARELVGTAGVFETFALTDHDTLRVLVTSEPHIKTCVVEIGLASPYRVKQLGCLASHEKVVSCVLSPKGAWLGCSTVSELKQLDPNSVSIHPDGSRTFDHKRQFRLRTMDVATGKVYVDRAQTGTPSAISDDGLFVIYGDPLTLIDTHDKARELAAGNVGLFTHFRNTTELITETGGAIKVIDVTKPAPPAIGNSSSSGR